ncbi:MAG: SDR family oxidoreductase [Pseudomonadota bacterium]
MKVFITGSTGWVGSAVVQELVKAGHQVLGLVRSGEQAAALAATGAQAVPGSLDDLALLAQTATRSDAVIHTAFNHDFSKFAENAEQDRRAIRALAAGLAGTPGRRLIVTSGTALVSPGTVATEAMEQGDLSHPRRSESEAQAAQALGLRVSAVRLAPTVHGAGDHGFVPALIDLARRTGVSAYVGDGSNRWSAVHRMDAARLYRLVLESAEPRFAWHGVAEEGIRFRDIAEVIGKRLNLPVAPRGADHFGWFARFAGGDFPASNAITRDALQWTPASPSLLDDLDSTAYFPD